MQLPRLSWNSGTAFAALSHLSNYEARFSNVSEAQVAEKLASEARVGALAQLQGWRDGEGRDAIAGAVTVTGWCQLRVASSFPVMNKISYRRHRFPAEIIQRAVWLCFRFPLSYRDVEDLLAERGVDVSYETIRRWALKFGQAYARKLRQSRPRPDDRWHLDEVFSSINGKRMYLWRAVDSEGEVLDILVQSRRNKKSSTQADAQTAQEAGVCAE